MRTFDEYKASIDSIKAKLNKDVALMAVSKTHSIEEIKCVYNCGIRLFGENKVQELENKFSSFKPKDLKLHMIGHLQSNKVSKVVPLVDMIESIDSFHLLEKVNKEALKINKKIEILLEYNTSGEKNKSGFNSEMDLFDCIEKSFNLENVILKGLMTVGPLLCSQDTRSSFKHLFELKRKCLTRFEGKLPCFSILSMGMSSDWEIAVEEGSNLVRIGTMIFGERNYE